MLHVYVKVSRYKPWRRLRGERRYSSYSFLTSALDGGEWSASRPGRALPPGNRPPVPIGQEARWAPELAWKQRLEVQPSASVGDRTPVVQSVVRHYIGWATLTRMLHVINTEVNVSFSAIIRASSRTMLRRSDEDVATVSFGLSGRSWAEADTQCSLQILDCLLIEACFVRAGK
jgi:hypothetical protein